MDDVTQEQVLDNGSDVDSSTNVEYVAADEAADELSDGDVEDYSAEDEDAADDGSDSEMVADTDESAGDYH